ncbi:MAG TPA: porin family protein [Burkholderiales bacterium]|nr:porin family protein [Burkholderiales bacterium]
MIINKRKHTVLATMIALGFGISPAASAQTAGFYAEGGIGVRAASTKVTITDPPDSLSLDAGKSTMLGSLGLGWRWESGNSVLGTGVFGNLAGKNAGQIDVSVGGVAATAKLEQKGHWGIGVEAGWKLAPTTTLYGKLAWHRAKFRASVDGDSISNNHTGVGLGVGLRHMFAKNSYVFAEWQQVNFNDKTRDIGGGATVKIDPRNTIGLVGVGWNF